MCLRLVHGFKSEHFEKDKFSDRNLDELRNLLATLRPAISDKQPNVCMLRSLSACKKVIGFHGNL